MYLKQNKKHWIINLIISLTLLTGCHVMLIGAYDQVTDESIQKIQSEVSSLIVTIENNIAADDEDSNKLLTGMVGAAKESLGSNWPGIKDVATTSFKSLAQHLADIEQMKLNGTITPQKAALLIGMQKDAVKIAIATEEGLGLLAAE